MITYQTLFAAAVALKLKIQRNAVSYMRSEPAIRSSLRQDIAAYRELERTLVRRMRGEPEDGVRL